LFCARFNDLRDCYRAAMPPTDSALAALHRGFRASYLSDAELTAQLEA
jgi:hypothetical protein